MQLSFLSRKTVVKLATACVALALLAESVIALRNRPAAKAVPLPQPAEIDSLPQGSFSFSQTFTVHGSPEKVYDALTGDITAWWDHSLSGRPKKIFIDPRPGGGFFEMIGDSGDGIRHATVTYADRGKRLTLQGPLPFSGHPIMMLTTYALLPYGDSTRVTLTVRAEGEMQREWPARVERNWRHFIYERFVPYWETHENAHVAAPAMPAERPMIVAKKS